MGNQGRDSDGRFAGAYRVNVESVPRLPIFPARWTLEDPRGRPYFVFWTSPEGVLSYAVRMERSEQGKAIQLSTPDGGRFRISIAHQGMPMRGGTAILYRCPGCGRRRRYLYLLTPVGGRLVGYRGPQCQACAKFRWASQGAYRPVFVRGLEALLAGGRPVRDPCPRHPWDPRAVSDPRMVLDKFPDQVRERHAHPQP